METDNRVAVYTIFRDFFGEDKVDLQDDFIIIYFPKVTVTNEHDRSEDITKLFVRVQVSSMGTIIGSFQMIRSEYTYIQFTSGYCHSHITSITKHNICEWKNPCLGTGPIRGTIASLVIEYSEEMWNLFCYELSKYVTVESIAGIPYKYLEQIGQSYTTDITYTIHNLAFVRHDNFRWKFIQDNGFISYIIDKKPFKFNFNGSYGIAESLPKVHLIISNLFIDWYNSLPFDKRIYTVQRLKENQFLIGAEMKRGMWTIGSTPAYVDTSDIEGSLILTFKGKSIYLHIDEPTGDEDKNTTCLLLTDLFMEILLKILASTNYGYKRNQNSNFGEALRIV